MVPKSGTSGASGALTTRNGTNHHGNSTGSSGTGGDPRAPMNSITQEALDKVQNPSRTHGHCCEIDAVNKALNSGENVQGASMGAVRLNQSGRVIGPCSTCREVMRELDIDF